MNAKYISLILLLIIITVFLRFFLLDQVPAGLNNDEVSLGYNAYSLLETGKDVYNQPSPIMFRSLGSYQAPLYTYLTIIPIYFLGLSVFSTRVIAALAGTVIVLFTFLIVKQNSKDIYKALLTAFLVSVAPWSILFSRMATEAILGLVFFIIGIYLLLSSLKFLKAFIFGCLFLGISTHAYYSERLLSIIFIPTFLLVFKDHYLRKKQVVILGVGCFLLTQFPHILLINSDALTRRLSQVSYLNQSLNEYGIWYTFKKFVAHYISYLSFKNLFYSPDPQPPRSIPNLSVFFSWMIIPFLIGIRNLIKNLTPLNKTLFLLLIISPLPAALTGDAFYTLRVLLLLWVLTVIISSGLYTIFVKLSQQLRVVFIPILLLYMSISLLVSYFILFKYERSEYYGYSDFKLVERLNSIKDKEVIIDLKEGWATGLRIAFIKNYHPAKFQEQIGAKYKNTYYNDVSFEKIYIIDNITVKPINWADSCRDVILVGDTLAISTEQVKEHKLTEVFEIKDMLDQVKYKGYQTNPKEKCF